MLRFRDKHGNLQLHVERAATRKYFQDEINPNTVFFHSLEEKLQYLVENNHYDFDVLKKYDSGFIKSIFEKAYSYRFRFKSLIGALKYYKSYTLKTNDGKRYLERYEDRVVMNALMMGNGDTEAVERLLVQMMRGVYQPATPTFLNAGRKQRGELVSCFLLNMSDSMEAIGRTINSALQLSKRGGGVAINLSNLREDKAPIKGVEGVARGPVPVMKILEDSFSYADQLGARQGAGAIYIHACHPDVFAVLDTKRENADEKIRIKTLSVGVVIPDIVMKLAEQGKDYYAFSPYSIQKYKGKAFTELDIDEHYHELVEDSRIKKFRQSGRKLLQRIAELEQESGYPYIMFESNVNRLHPNSGRVNMSNLCTEILQSSELSIYRDDLSYEHLGKDISCNLGSLNVKNAIEFGNLEETCEVAIRALSYVSDSSNINSVPSIANGNSASHAVGLGQMNLHGFLMSRNVAYGSPEAIEFTSCYFAAINYYTLLASNKLAKERKETYQGFEHSKYASGEYFEKYVNQEWLPTSDVVTSLFGDCKLPTVKMWTALMQEVMEHGLYNAYRQAVAPTGSISYINNSTACIHAITERIEERKEGKTGTLYYTAPELTDQNYGRYINAFDLGWRPQIDMYAAANEHVDQGLSLTLFFKAGATTRDLNLAHIYAWRKGIRTIYYVRLAAEEFEGCESCSV